MSNPIFSKYMPKKFGSSDGTSNFALGRKAFANKIYESHLPQNLPSIKSSTNTSESGNKPKPLTDKSSDLRIQRLRLMTIGNASTSIKNNNDKITFGKEDKNLIARYMRKNV